MTDQIIRELRTNRERLLEEKGGLPGLLKYLKEREGDHPERVAAPSPTSLPKESSQRGGTRA